VRDSKVAIAQPFKAKTGNLDRSRQCCWIINGNKRMYRRIMDESVNTVNTMICKCHIYIGAEGPSTNECYCVAMKIYVRIYLEYKLD